MDGQIRRPGAWLGDLRVPTAVRVYLQLRDGTYHPGMFVCSLGEALRLIVEYCLSAPRAFITLRDEVVLDVCEGGLEFPDDSAAIFEDYKSRFPSWIGCWAEPDNLREWVKSRCAKLTHEAKEYAASSGFDGSKPASYDHPVSRLERELQSVAARYGLNLFAHGFEVPGFVCAELERFASDVAVSGLDHSSAVDDESPPDLQDSTELAAQISPEPALDLQPEMGSSKRFDLNQAIRSRWARSVLWYILTKPVRAILLAGIVLSAIVLITGRDLEDSLSRLFMIMLYSTMVVFALAFYRVLEDMVWGAPTSGADQTYSDELDEHIPRGGRIPRSMDPSDPASGNFWMGNHARDQIIKEHMDQCGH